MTPEILSTTNLRFLELKKLKDNFLAKTQRTRRQTSKDNKSTRQQDNKIHEIGEDALTKLIYSLITFRIIVLSPIVIRK